MLCTTFKSCTICFFFLEYIRASFECHRPSMCVRRSDNTIGDRTAMLQVFCSEVHHKRFF
jgi:hypothetical protein